jgi:outer membrane murein-binding lipoprotein Lpp
MILAYIIFLEEIRMKITISGVLLGVLLLAGCSQLKAEA